MKVLFLLIFINSICFAQTQKSIEVPENELKNKKQIQLDNIEDKRVREEWDKEEQEARRQEEIKRQRDEIQAERD